MSDISVRFLLFPSQKELIRQINSSNTFGQIKIWLISHETQVLTDVMESEMRFIYCGKVVNDSQTLEELRQMSKDKSQVTIHLVVRSRQTAQPQQSQSQGVRPTSLPIDILHPIYFNTTNNSNNSNNENNHAETPQHSPTQEEIEDWGRNIHFHGCFFNEEEAHQVAVVFDKKKGADEMMDFTDVHMFLRHYWKWLGSNNHRAAIDKFPMDRMMSVKKSVVGSRKRVSLREFRQIFFLFDNNSSTDTCPHGSKERVKRATEELHRSIEPDEAFQNERFDHMFSLLDKDHDGSLSCCELELFYYMYTLETMAPQRENNDSNNIRDNGDGKRERIQQEV